MASNANSTNNSGSSAVEFQTAEHDQTSRHAALGTERHRAGSNVSWGAIIGGVVTFLALSLLLSMVSAAMGLTGASGVATGIWTVIALAVALAAAGYVAGALAARGGLFHGFLTWASSLLAVLFIVGSLGASALGAAGSVLSTVTSKANVSTSQVQDAAKNAQGQVSQQDIESGKQQAQQAAGSTGTGLWWAVAGTLLGGLIATAAGIAGAGSVSDKKTEVRRA